MKEGLKRPNYEKIIDETLAKYGYTKEQIPEWIWKLELQYRLEEYKEFSPTFRPYLAFTLNYEQAKNYAFMGGEFEYILIYRLFLWKTKNPHFAEKKAIEGRGKPKVVIADIPTDWIPSKILEQIKAIEKAGYDPHTFTWNIPIFSDVPVAMIVRIEQINLEREHIK